MLRNTKTNHLNISLLLIGLLSLPSVAAAIESTSSVKSINYASETIIDESTKKNLFELADSTLISPSAKQVVSTTSGSAEKLTLSTSYMYAGDFSIYNVSTDLISDYDYDNLFHRFSITVDADTIYTNAYVYAKIYLSYEGGPWSYIASSDAYHIYSDSSADAFTIETELTDGFYAGYYDVRIELYDADNNEWILSYGPLDDSSISALPLEDRYNDYYNDSYKENLSHAATTEVFVTGHGSMSYGLLIALSLMILARRVRAKQ